MSQQFAQDPHTGRIYECDARGSCEECGDNGPLYLEYEGDDEQGFDDFHLLCWRCQVGRVCPVYARARQDNGARGSVTFGRLTVSTNSWAGEVRS